MKARLSKDRTASKRRSHPKGHSITIAPSPCCLWWVTSVVSLYPSFIILAYSFHRTTPSGPSTAMEPDFSVVSANGACTRTQISHAGIPSLHMGGRGAGFINPFIQRVRLSSVLSVSTSPSSAMDTVQCIPFAVSVRHEKMYIPLVSRRCHEEAPTVRYAGLLSPIIIPST